MKTNNKRQNTFLKNLVLLAVVVGVCLLIGEIFLRTFMGDRIVLFPRYQTDAQYGEFRIRKLRPNTRFTHTSVDGSWEFRINSQGFRNDRDFSYKKPEGTMRILSLGDSHTEGFEVRQESSFSSIVERYLNGNGIGAEVINAGVSGFSTAEELVFLENEGIKYQPDVVVLGFYANDFSDNVKSGIFTLEDGELVVRKYEHIPGVRIQNVLNEFAVIRWASENSYLYSFVFNTVWNLAKSMLKTREEARLQTEFAIPTEKISAHKKELAMRLIERMYEFCKSNNIILIILDIPQTSKAGEIKSSIFREMLAGVQLSSDKLLYSKDVLYEYRNIMEIHVPHGHRHISEFTHLIYGLETARLITEANKYANDANHSISTTE